MHFPPRIRRATPQRYSPLAVPGMWGTGPSGPLPALPPIKLSFFGCLLLLFHACKTFCDCWVRHSQNVMLELALGINICGQKEMQAPHVGQGWDLSSCKAFCLHGATPRESPKRCIKSHRTCSAPRLMSKLHFEWRNTTITLYLAVIHVVFSQLGCPTADHAII